MDIDDIMEHKKPIAAVIVVILLVVVLLIIYFVRRRKANKVIQNMTKLQLWNGGEKRNMKSSYQSEAIIIPEGVGVSYAFNLFISNWIYDRSVQYRDIMTHGTGSFSSLDANDIMSVALDGQKNDIRIKINTTRALVQNAEVCAEGSTPTTTGTGAAEELVVKYVPIAEPVHLVIVVAKKRVDIYLNGKLSDTRILGGHSLVHNNEANSGLPLKFFQEAKIDGHMSNFNFFNSELALPRIVAVHNLAKKVQ